MTDDRGGDEPEEIGTVAEETAKLLSALQDWAKDTGQDHASAAAQAAQGLEDSVLGISDHIGHGQDCRFCPICQVINVVRETSPEVRQHLVVAASSLLQAMQQLLATQLPDASTPRRTGPVEKIDLDDDGQWDDE